MNRQQHHIPGNENTELLWTRLFNVRIPYLQSRTIDDIKEKGVVISGVPEMDRDIPNQWTTTYTPVAYMAEYFKEGVAIKVVIYDECKVIYDIISLHINAWKEYLNYGLNIGNAPIEDLIVLDQFAAIVYDKAKHVLDPAMFQQMRSTNWGSGFNRYNIFKDRVYEEQEANRPKEETEHAPMADFFKNKINNIRRY